MMWKPQLTSVGIISVAAVSWFFNVGTSQSLVPIIIFGYFCNFCFNFCLFVDCFQYMMMNLRVKSFLSEKVMSIMAQQSSWFVLLPRWPSLDW